MTASQAQDEVRELAELLFIPVATSLNGKGALVGDHPLSVGVVGSYSRWSANMVVDEADLALFIGSHTGSQVSNEWLIPRPGTPTIQIDIDPAELGRNYPNQVSIQGDAKVTLRRLIESLEPARERTQWLQRVSSLVEEFRQESRVQRESDAMPMRPERICKELSEWLPSDSIVVADTGPAGIWTGTMLDLKHPGQSYIRAAGSLGWGFPAALGAKCAAPERPVVCFTGDGGFWYHIGELETAARRRINAVIVVNNNCSLNQVKRGAERPYVGQSAGSDELWQFTEVDFSRIAEDMGCYGARVTKPSELRGALEVALASNRPAVVDVISDIEGIAPPAWA